MSDTTTQALEVSFELWPEDFVQFNRHWAETSDYAKKQIRKNRLAFGFAFGLLGAGAVALGLYNGESDLAMIFGIVLSIVLVVYLIILPGRVHRAVELNARRQYEAEPDNLYLFGPKRYSFDARGFRYGAPLSGGYILWPAVRSVEVGTSAAYLMVASSQAHVIPRRAFANPLDFDNLLGWIEYWRGQAALR